MRYGALGEEEGIDLMEEETVVYARVLRPYVLRVLFADGFQRELDPGPILHGAIFEPLRDAQMFGHARVDHELGMVVWPNGADLAPEFLREGDPVKAARERARPGVK